MTNRPAPKIPKWPFVLTDLLLIAVAAWALYPILPPKTTGGYIAVIAAFGAWMFGAWICIKPWVDEFHAQTRQLENETLNDSVQQIARIEEVASRIQVATASWQTAQDAAGRTTASAKEIEEKMRSQLKEFIEFNERVDSEERKRLNLEVEKLRRIEAEWLQVAARMLDHTFAITQAAQRSGQPNLASQMTNFQGAIRDAARRVGLIPFHPNIGDRFDERGHQLEDAEAKPAEDALVADVLATGFTFQGQLLRKSLVRVQTPEPPTEEQPPTQQTDTPEPDATTPVEEPAPESAPEPEPEPQPEPETAPEKSEAAAPAPEPELETVPEPQIEPEAPAEPRGEEPRNEEDTFTIVAVESAGSNGDPAPPPPRPRRARKPDPQSLLPF